VSPENQGVREFGKRVTLRASCHSVITSGCVSFARHFSASSGLFEASSRWITVTANLGPVTLVAVAGDVLRTTGSAHCESARILQSTGPK